MLFCLRTFEITTVHETVPHLNELIIHIWVTWWTSSASGFSGCNIQRLKGPGLGDENPPRGLSLAWWVGSVHAMGGGLEFPGLCIWWVGWYCACNILFWNLVPGRKKFKNTSLALSSGQWIRILSVLMMSSALPCFVVQREAQQQFILIIDSGFLAWDVFPFSLLRLFPSTVCLYTMHKLYAYVPSFLLHFGEFL